MIRFGIAFVAGLIATQSHAAVVNADGASASSEFNSLYDAGNTIDGSGLSAANDPFATHASYAGNNHWTTAGGNTVGAYIDWTFSSAIDFGSIYIWTHRSDVIASNSGYEPTQFQLTLFDTASNILADYQPDALNADTNESQQFSAASAVSGVSRVRFTVLEIQNPQSPFTGLAEVLFDTDTNVRAQQLTEAAPTVPLPAGLPLLLAGIGAFGWVRHRQKSS